MRNNTSFCEKQHVVLWETTRRFCTKIFGKNTPKRDKSTHFFRISITDQQTKFLIPLHFIDILHLTEKTWHLWQQKNNIAVGRRALRVHAREFSLSAHLSLPLRLGENLVTLFFSNTFDRREWQNRDFQKNIVTCPRFFHSFRHFEPIYYRELVVEREYTEDSAQDEGLKGEDCSKSRRTLGHIVSGNDEKRGWSRRLRWWFVWGLDTIPTEKFLF